MATSKKAQAQENAQADFDEVISIAEFRDRFDLSGVSKVLKNKNGKKAPWMPTSAGTLIIGHKTDMSQPLFVGFKEVLDTKKNEMVTSMFLFNYSEQAVLGDFAWDDLSWIESE